MKFSKGLKLGGVVATGFGLYGNGEDWFQTCITNNDVMSEARGRSTVKNVSSMALNAGMGIYGGDISNKVGSFAEGLVYD